MILPIAHLGHWLWIFYVLPVLIVVGGVLRSTRAENRREQGKSGSKKQKTRR